MRKAYALPGLLYINYELTAEKQDLIFASHHKFTIRILLWQAFAEGFLKSFEYL